MFKGTLDQSIHHVLQIISISYSADASILHQVIHVCVLCQMLNFNKQNKQTNTFELGLNMHSITPLSSFWSPLLA